MYYHNSTIRVKTGYCQLCDDGKRKPLSKGLCQTHYDQQSKIRSMQRVQVRGLPVEDGLSELIEDADAVFSRYVRLSASDDLGVLSCYICGTPSHYKEAQAMHFIPRGNLYLRYDPRNVRAGCGMCNEVKGGNLVQFAKRLNEEQPGLAEILMEETEIVNYVGREEIRQVISEYSRKAKELLKNIPN